MTALHRNLWSITLTDVDLGHTLRFSIISTIRTLPPSVTRLLWSRSNTARYLTHKTAEISMFDYVKIVREQLLWETQTYLIKTILSDTPTVRSAVSFSFLDRAHQETEIWRLLRNWINREVFNTTYSYLVNYCKLMCCIAIHPNNG